MQKKNTIVSIYRRFVKNETAIFLRLGERRKGKKFFSTPDSDDAVPENVITPIGRRVE